jgi:ABC-type transporter MlaC component
MNKLIILVIGLLVARPWSSAVAATTRTPNSEVCGSFLRDMKQMKEAQESIQQSLISNHDMMADSLETYADALKETSGKAYKKISENMYKASESVRKRKTKAHAV